MKKILITSIMMLVISAALFAYSAIGITSECDKISYKLNTVYGDANVLDGVKIKYKSELNSGMLWKSNIEFSGGEILSDVKYKNIFNTENKYIEHRFINMNSDGNDIMWHIIERFHENIEENQNDIRTYENGGKIEEQYRRLEAGEIDEFDINVKKYSEYYPVNISVSIPKSSNSQGWDTGGWSELIEEKMPEEAQRTIKGFHEAGLGDADYLFYRIYDLYRIPVEEGYTIKVKGVIDPQSKAVNIEFENALSINTDYVSGMDRDYFWANIYNDNGGSIKLPNTEKKRGLYSIDIKNGEFDADSIRLLYDVDSNESIYRANLSSDYSDLRLITEEKGKFYLIILDAKSGEVKQKTYLASEYGYSNDRYIYLDLFSKNGLNNENDSDEFIGVKISDEKIVVFVRDEEGRYVRKIDAPISPKVDIDAFRLFLAYNFSYSYKDGRLLVATHTNGNLYEGGTRYIGTYNENGLQYFGEITCSLAKAAISHEKEVFLYEVKSSIG